MELVVVFAAGVITGAVVTYFFAGKIIGDAKAEIAALEARIKATVAAAEAKVKAKLTKK
jgi:hypothetical protein